METSVRYLNYLISCKKKITYILNLIFVFYLGVSIDQLNDHSPDLRMLATTIIELPFDKNQLQNDHIHN